MTASSAYSATVNTGVQPFIFRKNGIAADVSRQVDNLRGIGAGRIVGAQSERHDRAG